MLSKLIIVILTTTLIYGCSSENIQETVHEKTEDEKNSESSTKSRTEIEKAKEKSKLRPDPNFTWDGKVDFDHTGTLTIKELN